MKILYVEDNPDDLVFVAREMAKASLTISMDTALSIAEAKNKLSDPTIYELVLIDMNLPDGVGLDLLSFIRKSNAAMPVIILTGFGDEDAAVLSMKAGADDYIAKKDDYHTRVLPAILHAVQRRKNKELQNTTPVHVLYVEHNAADVELTKRHIERYSPHIHMEIVRSANEALAKIPTTSKQKCDYDLVLLDYRLPGLNAIEILKIVIEERALDLPVIVLSGQGDEEIAAQALKLGAEDYIIKNEGYLYKLPTTIQHVFSNMLLKRQQHLLQAKNDELNNYFDNALDLLCIADEQGKIIRVNREWTESLGYGIDEILSKNIKDFVYAEDLETMEEYLEQMRSSSKLLNYSCRFFAEDESIHWLEWRSYRLDDRVYSIARDITESMKSKEKLRETNEFLEKLLEYSNVPIVVWVPDFQVTHFNRAFENISERSAGEVFEKGLEILIPEQHREAVKDYVLQTMQGTQWEHLEIPIVTKSGAIKYLLWNSANITGSDDQTIIATIAQGMDITERKIHEDKYRYLSVHDYLTGVYNRSYFEETFKEFDSGSNLPLTAVYADVNGLKLANDAFGHKTGDDLLKQTATLLKKGFGEDAIIIRMGGDEFLILLPNATDKVVELCVQQVKEQADLISVNTIELSISFGWETKVSEEEDLNEILKKAEHYMYRKKLVEGPSMRGKTIYAIINTLHEKNHREELHSRRVSNLCELIARSMEVSENSVDELITVGLLHDIGKIAIEESILNKAGKLSEEEWQEIKRHPEVGYRILSAVNDMADLAEYVLSHHERWDGFGYPRGLKGDEIPWVSRVIAIADTYDAITSARPYRTALSKEAAVREIEKNSGSQFDPQIVELFLNKVAPTMLF